MDNENGTTVMVNTKGIYQYRDSAYIHICVCS